MGVYIDQMEAPYGRMKMCHMVADTSEELLAMADKIGIARKWLQKAGTEQEHFDICLSKKRLALKLGAVEIEGRMLIEKIRRKRGLYFTGKQKGK